MLPRRESDEPGYEQAAPISEGYKGSQIYARSPVEIASEQHFKEAPGEKVYPQPPDNKNLFRFAIAALSMVTLTTLVILCLIVIGGIGGWISFIVAGCVIFGVAVAALASTK